MAEGYTRGNEERGGPWQYAEVVRAVSRSSVSLENGETDKVPALKVGM